jgi:hypothetical protein
MMAIEYICDGCGKRASAVFVKAARKLDKPPHWFQRSDEDGQQDACSRRCIDKIAEQTGKTKVVLPW